MSTLFDFATSDFDLGSDHRDVIANLTSRQPRARRWTKPQIKRGWQASDDFYEKVIQALNECDVTTRHGLRAILAVCARDYTKIHPVDDGAKPWTNLEG